jgi:hypothetical protein
VPERRRRRAGTGPKGRGDREAAAEKREQRLEDLHAKLAEGVEKLTTSEGWKHMLSISSKLHRYSAFNVLLLMMQNPDVTAVAGYKAWQAMGRQVRRGEQALWVLAPVKYKEEVEDEKTGEKGSAVRVRGFKPASVWDISQTDGPELPTPPKPLEGEAPAAFWDGLVGVLQAEGYTVERTKIPGGAKGDTSPDKKVRIDTRGTPLEQLAVLAHEVAHVKLGHIEDIDQYRTHRGRFEVEAESTAFIIMSAMDLDTTEWSADYCAGWAKRNPDLVQETASKVVKTANGILDELAPTLEQENGIDQELVAGLEVEMGSPE